MKYLMMLLLLGAVRAQAVVIPRIGNDADLKFHPVFVDEFAFAVADGVGGIEIIVDPLGGVTLALGGQVLASGTAAILDGLPGGESDATVGTNWCWSAPGPVSGPFHMHVDGSGASLGQALADLHEEIEALEDAGYTPLPASACEPEKGTLGPHMHP